MHWVEGGGRTGPVLDMFWIVRPLEYILLSYLKYACFCQTWKDQKCFGLDLPGNIALVVSECAWQHSIGCE